MSDQRDTLAAHGKADRCPLPGKCLLIQACQPLAGLIGTKAGHVPMPVHNPLCGRCLKSIRTYLLHSAVYNTIDDLFLADHIEDDDRNQRKQIRCKCQVVVRTELRLECQLCQRQCV